MNESGIYPRGNRVLVYPDPIREEKTSVIELPEEVENRHASGQASGTLVAVGKDAWQHVTEEVWRVIDGSLVLVEIRKRGYSEPFAQVGERVSYAKYAGCRFTGKDGLKYLVINDEDVTTGLDDDVQMSDLEPRKAISEV